MPRIPMYFAAASAALSVALPSQAAPPQPTGDYSAPYSGLSFYGTNNSCTAGATCTATGTVDAAAGRGTSTSTFDRSVAAGGREFAFGYAFQGVTYKVPPGASTVAATFTWRVQSGSVEASSSVGTIQAYTGVVAYAACSGDCKAEPVAASVQYAGSSDGIPSSRVVLPAVTDVSVTVTATGKLPRNLAFYAYPYSVAAGTISQACLSRDNCQTVSATHAGTASASIDAVLTRVHVASS